MTPKLFRTISFLVCLVLLIYLLMRLLTEGVDTHIEGTYVPLRLMDSSSNDYPIRYCQGANASYVDFERGLTSKQKASVEQCVKTYQEEHTRAMADEKKGREIRYTSHSYLNRNSVMIEAGGHRGLDTYELNSRFHPGLYIVLEPVPIFYDILVQKFQEFKNVVIYKFGIDTKDGTFNIEESSNDAVSIFKANSQGGKQIQVVNTTKFFEQLSVRSRDVDLITLNCEGCEYAVLDLLLSTDYIRHFRNIQFQSHRLPGICFSVRRFCWYQELLRKTHKLTFQFKFVWESWTRI